MAAAHLQLVTVVIARHHVERDIVLQILSVCLSRTSGVTREQRGLVRLKLAEVAHVTRDSDTTFKFKRSWSPGRFGWLYWQANMYIQ